MGYGMSVDDFQKLLDKRFPKGVHVRVTLGDGVNNFLVPRVFVTGESTLYFSPHALMEFAFEPTIESVETTKKSVTVHTTSGRTFEFTPLEGPAADRMSDRVKEARSAEMLAHIKSTQESDS